ncbi:hypothetical protein B566_EDAN000367 [Ephemera danica]|nr:hypothetical protein B566_EDAN000367 [Ephemera danica]
MDRAVSVGVGSATVEEIDQINILEATKLAMRRALAELSPAPDYVLIDAVSLAGMTMPIRPIIKGDALSLSIAAASIVAKVTRDRLMATFHAAYPQYNFLSHKGYGTEEHLACLAEHGPSPIHRRTFAPVLAVLSAPTDGETSAEQFLRRKGYRILERNLRTAIGELDLVADDHGVLVFVEVKARTTGAFGGALLAVGRRKQAKLIRLAGQYLAQRHLSDRVCRFDVVLVQGSAESLLQIEHIEHAFDVPDQAGW